MDKLNAAEIANLKICGKILKSALYKVIEATEPNISALALNRIAENELRRLGGAPSFLNYRAKSRPFPASLCVSINAEVVHGLPSENKIIKEGDLVSLDLGCYYGGVYTDMSRTIIIGSVSPKTARLVRVTQGCLERGIAAARAGRRIGDIGFAIQELAESEGFNIVRDLVGHGIGRTVHSKPFVPNFGRRGSGPKIHPGIALAIEPMLVLGEPKIKIEKDDWTVKTADDSLSAHFEDTILIEKDQTIIITR